MFDFQYQLKVLPEKPGVYLMRNSLGEIIYVGKAKILKNRVRQYFQNSKSHTAKVKAMVSNVSEFEYIVTDTEMEALILECNLIKKYKPRYNILLKDDKYFPFIKITTNEAFPRVFITRNIVKDGARYFGPYTDSGAVKDTLELIKKVFPIRNCKKVIKQETANERPCLNYQIGLCCAPCAGYITKDEYSNIISQVIDLLSGKDVGIVKKLKEDMEKAAENLEFEKAAGCRDKISAVKKLIEKQKAFTGSFQDEDYVNISRDEKDSCVVVLFLRDGKITGRERFILQDTVDTEDSEIISDFIKEFYGGTAFVPKNIYLPQCLDIELLEQWLTLRRGSKVFIKVPQKGEKKDILQMAEKNAQMNLEQFKSKLIQDKEIHKKSLEELASLMNLSEFPRRIEAYDISNIQGVDSVGSMVVFEDGKPKNTDYRRFKIQTVKGANDYESMREILTRRFKRGIEETKAIAEEKISLTSGKFSSFPDLIMMDGGKGQVNIALEVLSTFNINIEVCGLVKDENHNTRGIIYNNKEIVLPDHSNSMKLITRIQDEVHRFAITYHRSLRDKRILHSVLEEIPNIGEKRRIELLKKFGSIDNIKKADYEQLIATESIDKKAAESILQFFNSNINI